MSLQNNKYDVGDMIIIPYVQKVGIIVSLDKLKKKSFKYCIFWRYPNGRTELINETEHTIDMWFINDGGPFQNQLLRVPK